MMKFSSYSKLLSHWFACAFVLLFPLMMMLIYSDFIRESEWNSRLGWVLLLGGIVYLFKEAWGKYFLRIILLAFILTGSMDILYAITFGGIFTSASINAIFATDNLEFWDFLRVYTGFTNTAWLIFYLSLSFFLLTRMYVLVIKRKWLKKTWVMLSLLLCFVLVDQHEKWGRFYDILPGFMGVSIDYDETNIENSITQRREIYNKSSYSAKKVEKIKQLYIIVMGESLNRNHMSVYGYHRETTPELDKAKNNAIIFTDAITAFAQTRPSLDYALMDRNLESPHQNTSFIGAFKKAQFKTWWISNQQPMRYPTAALGALSDVNIFTSHEAYGVEAHRYDEIVLPHVKRALADNAPNKMIFIHLLGNHLQYKNRYPVDRFTRFDSNKGITHYKSNAIDSYDNSVYYGDYIISQIWQWAKEHSEEVALSLLFSSDHGEEIYETIDFNGHRPHNVTKNMIEVPFIFLYNDIYKKQFHSTLEVLNQHKEAPFLLENLFHFVLCSAHIETELLNEKRALCHPNYHQSDRIIYGKNYDKGEIP